LLLLNEDCIRLHCLCRLCLRGALKTFCKYRNVVATYWHDDPSRRWATERFVIYSKMYSSHHLYKGKKIIFAPCFASHGFADMLIVRNVEDIISLSRCDAPYGLFLSISPFCGTRNTATLQTTYCVCKCQDHLCYRFKQKHLFSKWFLFILGCRSNQDSYNFKM